MLHIDIASARNTSKIPASSLLWSPSRVWGRLSGFSWRIASNLPFPPAGCVVVDLSDRHFAQLKGVIAAMIAFGPIVPGVDFEHALELFCRGGFTLL